MFSRILSRNHVMFSSLSCVLSRLPVRLHHPGRIHLLKAGAHLSPLIFTSIPYPFTPRIPRPTSLSRPFTSVMSTFYDLKAEQPGNKTFDFSQLRGKVVLIVNVASQWYDSYMI
jgi:hypothetical protein